MIELPFPAKILWPNGRGHHMTKHKEFQKHKAWAYYAMLKHGCNAALTVAPRIDWHVTIHPKTANKIDDDNARGSLKAYQDGIAAAIGVNDAVFAAPTIEFAAPVKGGLFVVSLR